MATHREPASPRDTEKEESTSKEKDGQEQNEGEQSSNSDDRSQGDETSDPKFPEWPTRSQDIKPRVQECNYHQFKNFYDDSEMDAAIYALYGNRSLRNDINKEQERRKSLDKKSGNARNVVKSTGKDGDGGDSGDPDPADNKVLHRIRIQSPYILKQLCKLSGKESDLDRHFVFFRPFRILIYFQPRMKEILDELRNKWAETSVVDAGGPKEDPKPSGIDFDSPELLDSKDALEHMETYVKFMETRVMPLEDQFSGASSGRTKVAFEDLQYLFRVGQDVYRPLTSNKGSVNDSGSMYSSSMSSTYQQLWRIYSIVAPYVPSDPDEAASDATDKVEEIDSLNPADDDDDENQTGAKQIYIYCYCIEFDGNAYYPLCQYVTIKKYEGERAITSLPIYPANYLKTHQELFATQEKNGKEFMEFVRQRHVYHFGWTVSHLPTGSFIRECEKYPEFIDSEFIIDFQEAYQTSPYWNPNTSYTPELNSNLKASWTTDGCSDDIVPTRRWSENVKGQRESRHDCTILVDGDTVGRLRRDQFLSSDSFLSATRRGVLIKPGDADLRLLPKRLVGFALRERKFVNVSIGSIKPIREQNEAFSMLQLHHGHKHMVQSLVKEHFRLSERRVKGEDTFNQDFIRGKGTGLVFLLHGVPGVGKTATAEAIAQEHKKPLFAITCGDLGVDATQVDKNLTRIFRWATIWGCILLLDEADVFFTRRTPSDLQRNALVTVFLRILEYYSGVLFLTTNRVGIMDEAFKSRIHMSLYYPALGLEQTRHIFETNIKRLEAMEAAEKDRAQSITVDSSSIVDWAERHFRDNEEVGRWNGRQIRNAFQTAASLAHFDALNPDEAEPGVKPGVLNGIHFDKVAQATRQFDLYMTKVNRATDSELARRQGIRTNEQDDAAPPPRADRGFGIPQPRRNMQPYHGQQMQSSREMMFPSTQYAHPQYSSQENIYTSQEYGRGTQEYGRGTQEYGPRTPSQPYETFGRAAPTTPSRPPPQHMHQPDSGISMECGYRVSAQLVENVPMREERSPQSLGMPVKPSYMAPEEYDTRPYAQRPSAQPDASGAGYQGYGQQQRHLGNLEQGMWEGSRG